MAAPRGRSATKTWAWRLAALAVAACDGGGTPTEVPEVTDVPAPETTAFEAVLEPAALGPLAAWHWTPEPDEGQGTDRAVYARDRVTGPISVTAEICGSVQGDVYEPLPAPVRKASQTAEADDYRTLMPGATLTGVVNVTSDIDVYRVNATAGQVLSVRMTRTSLSLNPYLQLYDPTGSRVAVDDNSAGSPNALLNGITALRTGEYLVYAHAAGFGTVGPYEITLTQGAVTTYPTPSISSLSPSSATGTLSGSDFWVNVRGTGFTSRSLARLNGSVRTLFYESGTRVWVRLKGTDLGLPWPRSATLTVENPSPGGGVSNGVAFRVTSAFLGESVMEEPAGQAVVGTGVDLPFKIRWTHPSESWRVMRHMELRIHDANGEIRVRVRATEGAGATTTLGLYDRDGGRVAEGLPGEGRVLTHAGVELDLAAAGVAGSGSTVAMSGALRFGVEAEGLHGLGFGIVPKTGEAQEDDVLGTLVVLPSGCSATVERVTIVPGS